MKAHELISNVSKVIGGVEVSLVRDGLGLRVTAAVEVEVRGALNYRIVAHSRKDKTFDVWAWVRDFQASTVGWTEEYFYNLLCDTSMDFQHNEISSGETLSFVFNLDCEA